ncbi:MAG: selenocysteine lyase [Bdellovibrionales bacterium RIFCSPHIGHO2_01_FULL_40_29]|nr:MAG: selenocysteine lyase [Bdellovibrionales bacterium RIFCSPHIGHO2_01_FULL_40_29]OFZ34584.1 MAG: selenocysteine lyase [Bdellovibrionales bacterium RIFCSPHIGHO2_02_FULL_40_15]
MYKKFYSRFIAANPDVQHYASHSHHYWPDVTYDASIEYWNDSARLVDDKWDYIFSQKIPRAQNLIASILSVPMPQQIAFAPNTHEFVTRILSCFDPRKKIRILTTDSEFYSFDRQVNRLIEAQLVDVVCVQTQPFHDFEDRFLAAISAAEYDLIFLSHVFFNSGVVVRDLERIVNAVSNPKTQIVIDGYHGFMAVPTDLSRLCKRAFYLAGSYKYAQGGEGCCFLVVPENCDLRPLNTGWFAGFADLASSMTTRGQVSFSQDGFRFAGSTLDFSALYRLISVLELFAREKITVEVIHQHVLKRQQAFLADLPSSGDLGLSVEAILNNGFEKHGHFFAFEMGDLERTKTISAELRRRKIITDSRQTRLRFGFGLYQDARIKF